MLVDISNTIGRCVSVCCVLLNVIVSTNSQILGCNGDDPCRCTFTDGTGVLDISSVGNRDGTPRFPEALSYDGATYAFNPCFSFSVSGCSKASICQKDFSGSFNRLATQKSFVWSFNGFYPVLAYTNEDGRQTEVSMICDPSFTNPQLDVFGEITPGVLSFNLWSNCACPNACERVGPSGSTSGEGLTAGSVMLIVFFSLLAVYIVGGIAFNYNKQREINRSSFPNASFWAALPGLVKDGFSFTISKIRGTSSGVYTSTLPANSETSLVHGR